MTSADNTLDEQLYDTMKKHLEGKISYAIAADLFEDLDALLTERERLSRIDELKKFQPDFDVDYYRHPNINGQNRCKHCSVIMNDHGWIDTLEGGHIVCPKDWIITGVQGETYPCKPDIFEATYEPVESLESK